MPNSLDLLTVHIIYRSEFEAGDDRALLDVFYWCCLHGLPIPAWAATAFVERYRRGHSGEIRTWDEVFGRPAGYGTGDRLKRKIEQERVVLEEVQRLQSEGESLNEAEFEAIGRRLGVGGKTKVKDLLHDAREWAERCRFLYGNSDR
jgi:hypothetical protein